MQYVNTVRKFLVVIACWYIAYRAVNALDFWAETDRAIKAAQVQLAAIQGKGNI